MDKPVILNIPVNKFFIPEIQVRFVGGNPIKPDFDGNTAIGKMLNIKKCFPEGFRNDILCQIKVGSSAKDISKN
jgi:hypothetical protein